MNFHRQCGFETGLERVAAQTLGKGPCRLSFEHSGDPAVTRGHASGLARAFKSVVGLTLRCSGLAALAAELHRYAERSDTRASGRPRLLNATGFVSFVANLGAARWALNAAGYNYSASRIYMTGRHGIGA